MMTGTGGGKRAASTSITKTSKKNKDDKMEEKTAELQVAMLQVVVVAQTVQFAQTIGNHIEEFKQRVEANGGDSIITTALNAASLDKLRSLQSCLNSHDELTRITAVSKAIFMQDMQDITTLAKTGKLCENAIISATTLGFYHQFMTSAGIIEWESFRKVVNAAVEAAVTRTV